MSKISNKSRIFKYKIKSLWFYSKNTNDIITLKTYIAEYPQGEFVTEARHIIEDMNYNQAKIKDTVDSYKEYLDEHPDGKYVEDVKKGIVEKELSDQLNLSALLNSEDIEFLVKSLKRNEEQIQRVNERIEELFFKKAHKADNDVDAIKMHERYLQEYPGGAYAQEAKKKIEELSFNIAAGEDTIKAYKGFIEKYPQTKYSQKAVDRVEELALNRAKDKDTIKSYKLFLKEYPNSKFSQEVKYFENAIQKGALEAYGVFVKLLPDSSYTEYANIWHDRLVYTPYREKNKIKAFEEFINKYPENRYVNEAREKITELKQTDEPGAWSTRCYHWIYSIWDF